MGGLRGKKTAEPVVLSVDCLGCLIGARLLLQVRWLTQGGWFADVAFEYGRLCTSGSETSAPNVRPAGILLSYEGLVLLRMHMLHRFGDSVHFRLRNTDGPSRDRLGSHLS